MFGEVFDTLQSFYSHEFMIYGFVVGEDNEVMKSFVCKPFHLYQKLSFFLYILKRKILCGWKDKLNYLTENSNKLNVVGWLIEEKKNEKNWRKLSMILKEKKIYVDVKLVWEILLDRPKET